MKQDKDILGNSRLREHPYSVPDGYFEELGGRLAEHCKAGGGKRGFFATLAPYAAMAASFVLIALVGSAVIRHSNSADSESRYAASRGNVSADAASEEDIINYLIAEGISSEELIYIENYE